MAISSPAILKRSDAYTVNPRMILRKEGWNPRFFFGDIEGLAAQIKEHGVLLPLRVRKLLDGRFELIDGDRRLTAVEMLMNGDAAQALHFETMGVPVLVVDPKSDEIKLLLQMFLSNGALNFLPLEEADAFRRMKNAGMTNEAISKATGRSLMTLNASFALLESDASLQAGVKDGTVNLDLGRKIAVAARGDKAKQKELVVAAKEAGKDKVKRREVMAKVDEARAAKVATKGGRALIVKPLTADALSTLGAKVAKQLQTLLVEIGEAEDGEDFARRCAADNVLAAAFSLGALSALKAAAGEKISLTV